MKVKLKQIEGIEQGTTAPSSPKEGDLWFDTDLDMWFFYDSTRSKWLSVESAMIQVGKFGNTAAGSYFHGVDGITLSATDGYHALFDGTVVGFGYTRSDTDAATFDIVSGGSSLATIASSAVSGRTTSLNADFSAGGILALMNQTGGNAMTDVTAWIKVRWRA